MIDGNPSALNDPFRRTCFFAALMAVVAGGAEYAYGTVSNSDYLLNDSVDWLYSLLIYSLAAISYKSAWQRAAEFGLSAIFLIQGSQAAYEVVKSLITPTTTGARDIAIGSVGALAVALIVGACFLRYRTSDDVEHEAAWLAARNDAISSLFDVLLFAFSQFVLLADWPQTLSDALSAILVLWASGSIARRALRSSDQT